MNDDTIEYLVVVNDEEQHAIWPAYRTLAAGWRAVGAPARRQRCLDHIDQEWRDIRPLSVRRRLSRVEGVVPDHGGGER